MRGAAFKAGEGGRILGKPLPVPVDAPVEAQRDGTAATPKDPGANPA